MNCLAATNSAGAFTLLTYNVKGNGSTTWSTNSAQVQAIGRQVAWLQPDVITFNEIPQTNTFEMTNFVNAFLPGYFLATNSQGDGFIRNVILSRFPITRSTSHLHLSNLDPFGYTNSNFTRDLFEAQLAVPNFSWPLHIFTVHLKAGADADSAAKRAAEASAVSNFFVTTFLPANSDHPFTLSGDLNEDLARPDSTNQPVQRLLGPSTLLKLTTPLNPITGAELTWSIQSSLSRRIDYILPCGVLFSNIVSSQVFRTDLLSPVPLNLQSNDDRTASDHLPVLTTFTNPFDTPYRLTSIAAANPALTLSWQTITGRQYRLEISDDLKTWTTLAGNLNAVATNLDFATNLFPAPKCFRVYRSP